MDRQIDKQLQYDTGEDKWTEWNMFSVSTVRQLCGLMFLLSLRQGPGPAGSMFLLAGLQLGEKGLKLWAIPVLGQRLCKTMQSPDSWSKLVSPVQKPDSQNCCLWIKFDLNQISIYNIEAVQAEKNQSTLWCTWISRSQATIFFISCGIIYILIPIPISRLWKNLM